MKKSEVQKLLYKQKPQADLEYIRGGNAVYSSEVLVSLKEGSTEIEETKDILFSIPVSDMGDADFFPVMEAKHLIRWYLDTNEKEE